MQTEKLIAYFSMEIALDPAMPTYSGGLGVLAGDTLRAAADSALSMVGVTLLHRKGYFRQKLDASGWQTEEPNEWKIEKFLKELRLDSYRGAYSAIAGLAIRGARCLGRPRARVLARH
jgi:glycogen phosphorylase